MATAAPSAGPAPAAPAASPATSAEGQTPATPGAQSAQPKTIKPIPSSRPRLPGVLEDGPEDASSPEAVAARARDEKGRFARTADGTPVVEKATESATPEVPDAPEAKPKFKFAGREFDSPEAAEHWVKSMEGRYKPIQQKATESEAELQKAAFSAREWQRVALEREARIAELEKAGGGNPTPETPGETKGIDWDLFAEISKVANEAGEPWKAQRWLQEQYDSLRAADREALRAEIARLHDEAVEAPQREAAARAELEQTADTLAISMQGHKNPDGSPTFPEFHDGEQARAVGELWRSLDLPPELALTPGGAVAAVALYRLARAMDGAQPAASSAAAPPPPDLAAAAAAGLEGGRPLMPAATPRRELDPSVARLVAGLKNTELLRPGLGFEA